jgi:molecular chaperone GrpE
MDYSEEDAKEQTREELLREDGEVDFVPEDEFGSVGAAQVKIKKLRDELQEAKAKRDEYLDGWQRAKADAINYRKEAALSNDRAHGRGKESVFEDIIPVLDSFDMATGSESWESVDENWRSGMDQIRNQLLGVLSRHGIERFGKIGEMVDHSRDEIVQEMDDVAGEPGEIVRVLRSGYRSGERVIRPAQVIVKK